MLSKTNLLLDGGFMTESFPLFSSFVVMNSFGRKRKSSSYTILRRSCSTTSSNNKKEKSWYLLSHYFTMTNKIGIKSVEKNVNKIYIKRRRRRPAMELSRNKLRSSPPWTKSRIAKAAEESEKTNITCLHPHIRSLARLCCDECVTKTTTSSLKKGEKVKGRWKSGE